MVVSVVLAGVHICKTCVNTDSSSHEDGDELTAGWTAVEGCRYVADA